MSFCDHMLLVVHLFLRQALDFWCGRFHTSIRVAPNSTAKPCPQRHLKVVSMVIAIDAYPIFVASAGDSLTVGVPGREHCAC